MSRPNILDVDLDSFGELAFAIMFMGFIVTDTIRADI